MSDQVKNLVNSSWAGSTQASYNTQLKKWLEYCKTNNIAPYSANFDQGAEFLAHLYNSDAQYGTVTTARSMLSSILPEKQGTSFGKDPLVSRILKGIFKTRPSLPKHTVIYDTNVILLYIRSLPPNNQLLLELLTLKLCTLLCVLSGQRAQYIRSLNLDYHHKDEDSYTFYIPTILKTTTPTFHQKPLEFIAFPSDEKLCIVQCLDEYITRTELIRENTEEEEKLLVLSYHYPHKAVQSATLARYVKNFLGMAGIDLTVFSAHSTRSASSSKANNIGLSLKDIAKAAGWKSGNTFQKFYQFPIRKNFGECLVKAAVSGNP